MTESQIQEAAAELRAEGMLDGREKSSESQEKLEAKLMAQRLVDKSLITSYQADQMRSGRTKFRLGPYIVTDFIAQGGMGQVFKAIHEMMGREVALKVLPLIKATPAAIASFEHEVKIQAKLDHPNLVRAHDAGRDGNVYYLVTEYVPGSDLRRLVRNQSKLTQRQAATVISEAARGLGYAHECGLLHRDVKPGNILVTPDGRAKISDLGLSGFLHREDDPRAGKIVGTPDYLSPEQIRDPSSIATTSDIYSLGCTLYYAVCGKVPFPGGSPSNKARRIVEETPWHPKRFSPELSEEFVEVVADMMEKNPADRIQTAEEVIARLEYWTEDPSPVIRATSIRSPWSAPPLPMSREEEETLESEGDSLWIDSQTSQNSQGTDSAASQDTTAASNARSRGFTPSLPFYPPGADRTPAATLVALTLAVAVPISMLLGAVLMFGLLSLLWR